MTAFVTLEIRQGGGHDPVGDHLANIPEVLEAHTVTGPGDLWIRVVARSNADLQRVLDSVVTHPGIERSATMISLSRQIDQRVLPLVEAAAQAVTAVTGCVRLGARSLLLRIVRHVPAGERLIRMATISFQDACRQYPGATTNAVDDLNLEIGDGEFMVLVGPSGCGKSTSLRMLAGLEEVTAGKILIGDRDVTHLPPKDRDIAMVFQNYALYPHMTVADNMGFALKMAGVDKGEREQRVRRPPSSRSVRAARPQAEGDVGWSASARRDGPRDRPEPAGLLHGRAAVQPRRQAPGHHPDPDRRPAAAARRHHRLRHARPGRGHDAWATAWPS